MSIRLRIDALDERGAGVGRDQERDVHVAGALPGEIVRAQIQHVSPHRAVAWARLVSIESPSPDRVAPPCSHVGDCGGCPLMHLAYPAQVRAKQRRLHGVLSTLPPGVLREMERAGEPLGYRQTAKYVVVRRKGHALLGSYAPGTHRVADMLGCLVTRPPIAAVAQAVAQLCDEKSLTPRYVVIRAEPAGVFVTLVAWMPDERFADFAATLRRSRPEILGVSVLVNATAGNVILAGEEISVGDDGSDARRFRQANPRQAARLYQKLVTEAAAGAHATAFDLYCGAGAVAEALGALPGCDVVAVDRVPATPRGVRFCCQDVGDFLADAPPADLVVVNPPRKGLGDAVCRALARGAYPRLFYVSCMPESFARDVARLAEAYEVVEVRPYDLLPQTPHVEIFARLVLRH